MATTHPDTADTGGRSPQQVYSECIVENPRICNNCFRRYKDVEEPPGDDYWNEHAYRTSNNQSTGTLREITTRHTIRATTHGLVANAHVYTDWRNQPETRARPAWICSACGVIDGTAEMAARETTAFLTAAERLYDRLVEQDYDIGEEAFFATARAYKTDPEYSAKDCRIYERAVAAGLRGDPDHPGV